MRTPTEAAAAFVSKGIAKAIQAERLAAEHYRRVAEIAPDRFLAGRALGDAAEEARHAEALWRAAGRDAIAICVPPAWDPDIEGAHRAFVSCAQRRDVGACLFIQDVLLETVSIVFYEVLSRAAREMGALAVSALIEKAITPDERLHLAKGLRDIGRCLPDPVDRRDAFRRATAALLPTLLIFAETAAAEPCAQTCGACRDRCMRLDACAGAVPLAGSWGRIVAGVEDAARRVGIDPAGA